MIKVVFKSVSQAIFELSARGFYHSDIKPANIVLEQAGPGGKSSHLERTESEGSAYWIKLIDFASTSDQLRVEAGYTEEYFLSGLSVSRQVEPHSRVI